MRWTPPFIRAWSRQDLHDNSWGYSDPDAQVGRDDRTYNLGYRAHVAADTDSDIPVAFTVAPANENEKRHALRILDKAWEATKGRVSTLVADSQYSSRRFREKVAGCSI